MPHKGQNSSGGEASGPIVDPKDGVSVGPHQNKQEEEQELVLNE